MATSLSFSWKDSSAKALKSIRESGRLPKHPLKRVLGPRPILRRLLWSRVGGMARWRPSDR